MNYTIEHKDKIVIFTLKHENLGAGVASEFKAELLILCQPTIDALILDLSDVLMIDSSGLAALLLAHRQLSEHNIPIALVGLQKMVKTLISISQLDHLFEYAPTVDDAVVMLESREEEEE